MSKATKLLESMRNNTKDVRFADAVKVATDHFGEPRIVGSHRVFTGPNGQRVNLQPGKDGKAKAYQVEQLLTAIGALSK
jgi:predicted RNA binding protein YcfA (HicA-like mRNA interferase family)